MANPVIKRGLLPVGTMSGAPYSGSFRLYSIPAANATATFIGDLVTGQTTSQTVNGVTMQDVIQGATGDVFQGVVVGFLPDTSTSLPYRAASTLRVAMVADDPNLLFETDDISTGTPLAAADVGLNANIVVGTGSTVTGYGAMELDNSTEATTNTLDVKIVRVVNRADNDPASASCKFQVRLNRHRFANQVAGV
jgi:hypothetical protein